MRIPPQHLIFSILLLTFILLAAGVSSELESPQSRDQTQPCAAITTQSNLASSVAWNLCNLIETGYLADMRVPDFTGYRSQIKDFYLQSNYTPVWILENRPTSQAIAVIAILQNAEQKGLNPQDYDDARWNTRLTTLTGEKSQPSAADLARFDLEVMISLMRYIGHLHQGRIHPPLQFSLDVKRDEYNPADLIRMRVLAATDVGSVLEEVEPPYSGYRRTELALQRYLALTKEGDGPALPEIKQSLNPGDAYSGASQLAARLRLLGDLPETTVETSSSDNYAEALVEAVKHFQQRHGLNPNGTLDRETFRQIITPLNRRVLQLQLTLERWRWLPQDLQSPLIVVNIPEFQLRAYDNHAVSVSMRVIVGRAFRHQTPAFADHMEYLIFRPYWNVPVSIQQKELVPAIMEDRSYLARNKFEVVSKEGELVTASTVDDTILGQLQLGELRIRQRPGPDNSLGLVKFVFPNHYDVYLHGTPQKELFSRPRRDFSHGCIRVEDPEALAAWVLRDDPTWTRKQILSAMNGDQTRQAILSKPLPVLIVYGTAVVDETGEVHFYKDIYGHDAKLERALQRRSQMQYQTP